MGALGSGASASEGSAELSSEEDERWAARGRREQPTPRRGEGAAAAPRQTTWADLVAPSCAAGGGARDDGGGPSGAERGSRRGSSAWCDLAPCTHGRPGGAHETAAGAGAEASDTAEDGQHMWYSLVEGKGGGM
eukprot:2556479-Prymnesium_polylepis.1